MRSMAVLERNENATEFNSYRFNMHGDIFTKNSGFLRAVLLHMLDGKEQTSTAMLESRIGGSQVGSEG